MLAGHLSLHFICMPWTTMQVSKRSPYAGDNLEAHPILEGVQSAFTGALAAGQMISLLQPSACVYSFALCKDDETH